MKTIEVSDTRLIIKIQKYKVKLLDIDNNLTNLSGYLSIFVLLNVLWHQSAEPSEFISTLVICFLVVFIYISGLLFYSFSYQRDNFYEIDTYIFDRSTNSLNVECKDVWGSKDIRNLYSLSDVKGIFFEVSFETFPKEPTPEEPPTEFKTSYSVKIALASGVQKVIEHNSISVFSKPKVQAEFRDLITQTDKTVNDVLNLLEPT